MSEARADPALSVVVTIIDGGAALRRTIAALHAQEHAPPMEVLVPFDRTVAEQQTLARDYPDVRFIDMGDVATSEPAATHGGRHELFDRRRAAGVLHARAPLVALLEDRAAPRDGWAAAMHRAHAAHSRAIIGGAIECTAPDLMNWALYACDYSRYALPQPEGERAWASDVNVCYKRPALAAIESVWRHRFNEAEVHRELRLRGEVPWLATAAVVEHRSACTSLVAVLGERFHFGLVFGQMRAAGLSAAQRARIAIFGPILPLLLYARQVRIQLRIGNTRRLLLATPFIAPMLIAWSLGEMRGAASRRV